MRGSIRLFKVSNISINVHMTFFLLLFLAMYGGVKSVVFILGVFCFVTLHELCHSIVAQKLGIRVKEITLLPIGGVASMARMPEKASEEFMISIAGPLMNIAVIVIFYLPLRLILGTDVLHSFFVEGPSLKTWPLVISYIYWINLILAVFNLIPAFPMDGGRILRSILTPRMGYLKATKFAVNLGHIFALIFGYVGLRYNIFLVFIAIFIYMAASGEGMQVEIKEILKKFRIKDILSKDFLTIDKDSPLSKILELIFHSHQEDFAVVEDSKMIGFVTRRDIIAGMHELGMQASVSSIMSKNVPTLRETDYLNKAQDIMQNSGMKALPVLRGESIVGIVTIEDIMRVYSVMSKRG